MDILIKIIQFFLCFTLLVGIHEFGHFIVARMFKIRVEKFYIFFDPWFSLFKFKRGETEYGLGWLPLGGYCKIGGMIDESMDKEQMKQPVAENDFRAKPAWQRLLVMLAGVFMNVVLAVAVYTGICYTWGESYFANEDARWGYNFNEAGHALGFEDGDRITSIDHTPINDFREVVNSLLITESDREVQLLRRGQPHTLHLALEDLIEMRRKKGYENLLAPRIPFVIDSVVATTAAALRHGDEIIRIGDTDRPDLQTSLSLIRRQASKDITLTVLRGTDTLTTELPVSSEGRIGVLFTDPAKLLKLRTRHYTLAESVPAGFRKTGTLIADYWEQLKMIAKPETKLYEEVGGFIAIGQIFAPEWNWADFWAKTAFLSIILAVMNLLPIPGLDGGHAMFTFWELVTGRKVNERVLEIAQYIGMFLLLLLLFYANGNDIYKFLIK